ncbi:MAG TPA: hypothetical protein PKE45_23485, partial [Caldilineaceae bacterium]|nr:hypothetical protein [Caldilineaceae bacterium]
ERPSRSYTVFVQLLDADGVRVAGWDNPPCRGSCPTTSWQAGEYLRDEYSIALSGLAPGRYTLHIGMYDSESGVRLPILDDAGQPVDDNLTLAPVQID